MTSFEKLTAQGLGGGGAGPGSAVVVPVGLGLAVGDAVGDGVVVPPEDEPL
jgi:hypothetical protein